MPNRNPANRISGQLGDVAQQSREFLDEHAFSAAMVAFGLGFAAGVALVTLLSDEERQFDTAVTQRLGRRVLDALADLLPKDLLRET